MLNPTEIQLGLVCFNKEQQAEHCKLIHHRHLHTCKDKAMSDTLMLCIVDGPPGFQSTPSIWLPVALAVNLVVWAWFNVLYMALVSLLNIGCDSLFHHVQKEFMHSQHTLQPLHMHALAPILFLTHVWNMCLSFGIQSLIVYKYNATNDEALWKTSELKCVVFATHRGDLMAVRLSASVSTSCYQSCWRLQ